MTNVSGLRPECFAATSLKQLLLDDEGPQRSENATEHGQQPKKPWATLKTAKKRRTRKNVFCVLWGRGRADGLQIKVLFRVYKALVAKW